MQKTITRAAVIAGSSLLAATLLTGCAGEKHTFSGLEVSKLDKTIESLDASWSQHRANGIAATVDDSSRCFVQTGTDGVLADKALCGPVRYLGDDETVWESVGLQPGPDGKDKVTLSAGSSFSKNKPNANTVLYRTDGKKAADNASLTEPDTKAAEAEKALWDVANGFTGSGDNKSVSVVTPDGTVTVSGLALSDRVGAASDRLKAGDGRKFATANISPQFMQASSWFSEAKPAKTSLAFVAGGKTYPIGAAKSGTVSMSVPGDGTDVALAVVYGDFQQTVTLSDAKLHTTATALYDGIDSELNGIKAPASEKKGAYSQPGLYSEMSADGLSATRTAYDTEAGWAPEGKAWLRVTGTARANTLSWYGKTEYGNANSYFEAKLSTTSAVVTNVSGEKFSAEAKTKANTSESSGWNDSAQFVLLFEVPSGVADFSLSFTVNAAATAKEPGYAGIPATASIDYAVKDLELSFKNR